jgi:hypothetical protein
MQYVIFTLIANGFLPGGSGTKRRHNTKHIIQNYMKNGHTTHNEYNENTITTTTNICNLKE